MDHGIMRELLKSVPANCPETQEFDLYRLVDGSLSFYIRGTRTELLRAPITPGVPYSLRAALLVRNRLGELVYENPIPKFKRTGETLCVGT